MLARMSPIVDGTRNGTLFRIGVRLRHEGRIEPEILDALDRINALRAAPPLSGREVEKIARSAAREAR
jgi:Primase C terminal 1 (PriCT-1)